MRTQGHYVKRVANIVTNGVATPLSTTQSKFGTASLHCDGTNIVAKAYVSQQMSPMNQTYNGPGGLAGDFTIEFWIYPTWASATTGGAFFAADQGGIAMGNAGGGAPANGVFLARSHVGYSGAAPNTYSPAINTWTSIAYVRNSNNYYIFINGTNRFSNVGVAATASYVQTVNTFLGFGGDDTGSRFTGYISEFRLSNIARYTANYTPATAPFVNDGNTTLLLHFDELAPGNLTSITDDNS